MGEYADEYIDRWIGDSDWGSRRRSFTPRPVKLKNSQIFSAFARDGINFKTGDRVVHSASGSPGVVLATRGTQICWKPDNRILRGGIWIDSKALRYDI